MKKNIITLVAISLSLSGCGIYTKYKPATVVPDHLYGEEVVAEDTASLGNMDWRELFTDPYLPFSYKHLRGHETVIEIVCRLFLVKKKTKKQERQSV